MATVSANKLVIINDALRRMRHPGLSTLSTSSTDAIEALAANGFDEIVKEVLREAPWIAVLKRDTSLTAVSGANTDQFDYSWKLPTDFVRMVGDPLYNGSPIHYSNDVQHWRVTGYESGGQQVLETKHTGPDILYVFFTTFADPDTDTDTYYTLFDTPLKETIKLLCMARWWYAVTGNANGQQNQLAIYEQMKKKYMGQNSSNKSRIILDKSTLLYSRLPGA